MFTITLKRPLGILAITAGLLVAAGSASASQGAPHPPHAEVTSHTHGQSPTHRSTRSPAGGPAALTYTLSNTMISGYS
jgi:hypothetical protein